MFQSDNIYETVCNILATDLPIKEQEKVTLMILNAQHPHNLSIGGFDVLNVETFVYVSSKYADQVGSCVI